MPEGLWEQKSAFELPILILADGVIAEVTVKPGDQIDSKDLLIRFE